MKNGKIKEQGTYKQILTKFPCFFGKKKKKLQEQENYYKKEIKDKATEQEKQKALSKLSDYERKLLGLS